MTRVSKWVVALTGLLAAALPCVAWACSFDDSNVVHGVLGTSLFLPAATQRTDLHLPRNVAFVFWSRGPKRPQLTAAGAAIETELLGVEPDIGHFGLQTAREPLEPGTMYQYDVFGSFTVDDYLDETAPEPARVLGATFEAHQGTGTCSSDSCGDYAYVTARVEPGTDDHTSSNGLTYALHIEPSAQAALTTTRVERYLLADREGEVGLVVDYDWTARDLFLSISTLDHAGNESRRSEPIKVHSAASGCQLAVGSDLSSFVWVLAAMFWHANRRRSRGKSALEHTAARIAHGSKGRCPTHVRCP